MPFNLHDFFCGSSPNNTSLTNAIKLQFENHLSSQVDNLINTMTDIINSNVTKTQNYTKIKTDITSGSANYVYGNGWRVSGKGSILRIDLSTYTNTITDNFNDIFNSTQNSNNFLNNIKLDLENKAKTDIDFAAQLAAASEMQNKDSEKTAGEINNMVNKVAGLFDYKTSNTTINNTIDQSFKNIISSNISNTINDSTNIGNLFNLNVTNDTNTDLHNSVISTQIVDLTNIEVTDGGEIDVTLKTILENKTKSVLKYILNTNIMNNVTNNIDKKATIDTTTTIKEKVKITSVLKTTNTKEVTTTSLVDSLFNMITYIGIGVVVLIIVLAVVGGIIIMMKKKPGTAESVASTAKDVVSTTKDIASTAKDAITSGTKTVNDIATKTAAVKSSIKRIPGLPKF